MKILGIETSCDDTSAAVVTDGRVLSNVVASQDSIHAEYGGVVPELAARGHLETIQRVIRKSLADADISFGEIDTIAVTRGPGLVGSLLVGLAAAQGLGLRIDVPVYGVNHLEGHILSPLLEKDLPPPFLALLVSGGHSALYAVDAVGSYRELATTRDDSAGEAFDKAAKMMGLGYPGGKVIDQTAAKGDASKIRFPRARVRNDSMALSFSGLKTSLWDYLRSEDRARVSVEDVCASFQEAIVDVLVDRVVRAVRSSGIDQVVVAGGVSANNRLRTKMRDALVSLDIEPVFPSPVYCTDNAAMIAAAAWRRIQHGLPGEPLEAVSRLPLGPASGRL